MASGSKLGGPVRLQPVNHAGGGIPVIAVGGLIEPGDGEAGPGSANEIVIVPAVHILGEADGIEDAAADEQGALGDALVNRDEAETCRDVGNKQVIGESATTSRPPQSMSTSGCSDMTAR